MADKRVRPVVAETAPSGGLGREFRLYIAGQTVSLIGDRITLIALVFLIIHQSHSSAVALSAFYLSRLLPGVAGGLLAGVVADTYDRRRLMVACDLGRALLLIAIPSLVALHLWAVYPMVMLLYALTAVFDTAAGAALPDVVGAAHMMNANAILQGITTAADLAYAVGGTLVYLLGVWAPLYIDAITYAFSALMIIGMHIPSSAGSPPGRLRDILTRIREGFSYLLGHPFLKWSTLSLTLAPVAGGAVFVLVPLYANRGLAQSAYLAGPLRSGAFRFSLLEVSLGVGALLGSAVAIRLARLMPRGAIFGCGLLGMGVVTASFSLIENVYVAALAMIINGLFNSLFVIPAITLQQTLTPSEVRGRVAATRGTLVRGALALGSALGGVLLLALSYQLLWFVLGSLMALSTLFIWLHPQVRGQA